MDENQTPHEKHTSRWIVAVTCSALVLLVAVGGVFALRDQLLAKSQADAKLYAAEREKLAHRIDNLQSTLDTINSQPKTDTAALDSLNAKLAESAEKLEALNARLEAFEKKAEEKKTEPVAAAPAPIPAPTAAPASAESPNDFAALKLAVMSGKPFTTELAAWLKLHPEAEKDAIALVEVAQNGVMSESELSRNLIDTLDAKSKPAAVDDISMVGKINTHLKGLVSIKKSGADPYATLRKDALREDSATLAREVERLSETDRAPLLDWLKQAKERERALAALAKLSLAEGR